MARPTVRRPLSIAALASCLACAVGDGYVFEEVFTPQGQNGICEDDMTNRLCTTDKNGGVFPANPDTCVGRNDIGELPSTSCGLECAQARCEADEHCNGYVFWEGGHYGGNWNYRLVHTITSVSVVGGTNQPHCIVKRAIPCPPNSWGFGSCECNLGYFGTPAWDGSSWTHTCTPGCLANTAYNVDPPLGGVTSGATEALMLVGDQTTMSCAALNEAYSGTATLTCSDFFGRGKPLLDVSQCVCDNPFPADTDSYLCFKYRHCYSYRPMPTEQLDCSYDCSAVSGFDAAPQEGHCLPEGVL